MTRLSFLYRTDVHVADKSPESWKGDYPAEIWSNLEQIGRLTKDLDIDAVLDGGDFFHVKASSRNPHSLIYRTATIHSGYKCPTFCVEGNHDLAYNNLETLDRQPLGVLYATRVFQHLRDQTFERDGLKVRVVGVPYSPFRSLEELRAIQKRPGDGFLIAVVHALAGEAPPAMVADFFNEPVFRYSDLITPDGPDCWAFGHWHKDQGVVEIDGKRFINLGALSRGALVNENLTRTPKAAHIIVQPDGLTISPIEMKVLPALEVFDVEKKDRVERETKNIEAFVNTLLAEASIDTSMSIEDNLANMAVAADVRQATLDYLEQARAEVG